LFLNKTDKENLERAAFLVLNGFKGELDLAAAGQVTLLKTLGAGLRAMSVKQNGFPQAARFRQPDPARSGYQWEPNKRLSWMVELLPHLGHDQLYQRIKMERSWDDPVNLLAARTLVPEFLNPAYPRSSQYVEYPNLPVEVAATHYVGIAGIGEDVAGESEADAGNRLGVFGYDRVTALDLLKGRDGNTAVMIQVPPDMVTPWMAGGGSTVRGVPGTRSIEPFVSGKRNGSDGTYVLLANGSVRFVKNTISSEVFKNMCRIKGPQAKKQKEDDWEDVADEAAMKGGKKPPKTAPQGKQPQAKPPQAKQPQAKPPQAKPPQAKPPVKAPNGPPKGKVTKPAPKKK
jgi:hypothetical protein